MGAKIVLLAIRGAGLLEGTHESLLAQAVLFAVVGIGQFSTVVVTDHRRNRVVEERAVLDDLRIADVVFEAPIPAFYIEHNGARFAGLKWRIEPVNPILQAGIILRQRGTRDLNVDVVL